MLTRLFNISRSNKPAIINLSQLFISLSTGIFLILHVKYYVPLVLSEGNNYNLYSILCNPKIIPVSLAVISAIKFILSVPLHFACKGKKKVNNDIVREISFTQLIYPTVVKVSGYLSLILLLSVLRYLTFTLTVLCTLIFIFSLHFCKTSNKMMQILWKGRQFSSNKIKIVIIYTLVITAICLQPFDYSFVFQLHFQIFIIFSTSLLFFSYFYLHKLLVTVTNRIDTLPLLIRSFFIQNICNLFLIGYYWLLQDSGMTLSSQFQYIFNNIWCILLLVAINFLCQIVLLEAIRKISFNRLIISLASSVLWLNIYCMVQSQIEIKLYLSVIILFFVLISNLDIFSESNLKLLLEMISNKKKRKKKQSAINMEMKYSPSQH